MTPFGLNEKEYEKKLDARVELNKYTKVYLDIIAIVRKDGKITPISFKWDDREYKIDKVLECFKGMSAKYYIKGLRYKCRTGKIQERRTLQCDRNGYITAVNNISERSGRETKN